MDLAISLLFVAALGAMFSPAGSGVAFVLSVSALALAAWRLRQGRWQLGPLVLVIALAALASLASWNSAPLLWASAIIAVLSVPALLLLYLSPLPSTPAPSGTHVVGCRVVDIPGVDGSREDRLQIHLWYPAKKPLGAKRRKYLSGGEATVYSAALKALGAPAFLQRHFALADTHSYDDASPADGSFPLVVFNHGGAMWPRTNTSLMEEFASNGIIACSLAHPGESAGVLWSDGSSTLIGTEYIQSLSGHGAGISDHANFMLCQDRERKRGYLPALAEMYRETLTAATSRWAQRSIAVVDWLLDAEAVADLAARIDPAHVVYSGMSLGGSVAHECCFLDPRASAAINLDGMNWSFDRIDSEVPVPMLQFYNDPTVGAAAITAMASEGVKGPTELTADTVMYNDFYYESPDNAGSRDDVLRVSVPGTAHMAFTDFALSGKGPMRKLSGTGHADGRRVVKAVNEMCMTFLNDVFKGRGFERTRSLASSSDSLVLQRLGD